MVSRNLILPNLVTTDVRSCVVLLCLSAVDLRHQTWICLSISDEDLTWT